MSSFEPGKGGGIIPPVAAAATLPVTGAAHNAVQLALALGLALAAWAVAYAAVAKFGRR
ncbi:MAG TPA: hypothetical protein VI322_00720 [Candidatus Saccharimonadia bacterium]